MKKQTVSQRLNAFLKKNGWTVYKAAQQWGLPYNTLRDWAAGDHEPRGAALMMLNSLLDQ